MATTVDEFGNIVADDDSGSNSAQDTNDGTSSSTAAEEVYYENDGSGSTASGAFVTPQTTRNSGTTVAGKGGASSAGKRSKPGKRLTNPLGEFSSYTYQITLYMLTPDAYNAFITSGRKNVNAIATTNGAPSNAAKSYEGVYVVAQSGGINNSTTNRAPGFNLDYYIDNLEIHTAISQGKSTNSAGPAPTQNNEIKFQIIEPYGFSFISKLKQAWSTLISNLPNVTSEYMSQIANRQTYVLGIKFLGYDASGNIVSGQSRLNGNTIQSATSDSASGSFESFYDIQMSEMTFKLDGKAVTYNIKAAPMGDIQAKGLNNGRLQQDASVIGSTVDEMLQDLVYNLNLAQENQQIEGTYEIANQYEIVYIGPDAETIKSSSVVNSKVDSDKQKYPMQLIQPDKEVTTKDAIKARADGTKRQLVFKGGGATSIIQAIQTVVTQSDYIQLAIKDLFTNDTNPNPTPNTKEYDTADADSNKILKWINVSAEVINLGYDTKRSDFAWKIRYIIQSYETPVAPIAQVNKITPYYGPSKRYNYWFTGKNTEVTRFELTYNSLYSTSLIGSSGGDTKTSVIPKAVTKASAPRQGRVAGEALESQNTYVNYLNDASAYANAKISILGDPDWLLQDNSSSLNEIFDKYYGANGYTINCNNGQVFVEVDFKEAIDYDNTKGVMSVSDKLMFFDYPDEYKSGPNKIQGIAFNVFDVVSTFKGGKFEQTLNLGASIWDKPKAATTDATRENQSDAETARLARSGGSSNNQTTESKSVGLAKDPGVPTDADQSASTSVGNADNNGMQVNNTGASTQVTTPTGNADNPAVSSDDAQSQNTTNSPTSYDGASEAEQRSEMP